MNLQDFVERLKKHPVPSGCGAILLLCFLAFYFRMDLVSTLEARREEAHAQAIQMSENVVAGSNLEAQLEQMRALVAQLEERVVKQSELAVNLKYFYLLESETGVSLADLRQVVTPPAKGAGKDAYLGVGYNLVLSGTIAQAVAYFDELENGERFHRLNSFNLQRGREANQSTVTLALNLELLGVP